MAPRRSLILWTTGTAAAGVLVLLAIRGGQELRLRRACERARQALLAAESLVREPPPGLEELLGSNAAAFPVFARLLADDDPVVWTRALEVLDGWHEGARKQDSDVLSPLQVHLRDTDPVAWVRYQLPSAYGHSTEWRREGDFLPPDYWSGHPGLALAPNPRLLRFLRRFLEGEQEAAFRTEANFLRADERRDLEKRAVYAVRAMLRAAPPPALAVDLLRWTALEHRFASVRLAAVAALALIFNPFAEERPCAESAPWFGDDPTAYTEYFQELAAGEPGASREEPFHPDHRLELLAHVDSSWTLWVLVQLRKESGLRAAVERALGPERGRWPVPKPAWPPLEAAAARYLASPNLDERAAAMLALVEIGTPAARDVLAAREAREAHAELRLLARSGLAALGDARHQGSVEQELLTRLDALEEEWRRQGRISWPSTPRWPWWADGPGFGWFEPYRIGPEHLARHLLLAGSRATLDRAIQGLLEWGPEALLVSLGEHVEGLPGVLDGKRPHHGISFVSGNDDERRQISEWWQATESKLQWDVRRRRFTVAQVPGER